MDKTPVIVRFAPSPTGELHLGGARTALFNWLFAKQNGGKFYLRIEDTDQERSQEKYTEQICESLKWLGLHWDGPLIYQSERTDIYREFIKFLVLKDKAYRCFCSKESLEKARNKGHFAYAGSCRKLTKDDIKDRLNRGEDFTIRLKIPEGKTEYTDSIYGSIIVDHKDLDDFIIARTDGTPTYNLVVVVDDHSMGITHVIRGEDHMANTPKQLVIYKALEYTAPVFAHLPLILGQDKKRLSKRHGAPGVQNFRDEGYLPESLINYLALLGWNPGTEEEIFTTDELIQKFKLENIQKKGAVWDEKKLHWLSGQHLKEMPTDFLLDGIRTLNPEWGKGKEISFLISIIELMKIRIKSLKDLQDHSTYFFSSPKVYDEKTARKRWKDHSINEGITRYMNRLEGALDWREEFIENELRMVAEECGFSPGKLIHPVRLALSGIPHGPSLFAIMDLLGKETCLNRLKKALMTFPLKSEN